MSRSIPTAFCITTTVTAPSLTSDGRCRDRVAGYGLVDQRCVVLIIDNDGRLDLESARWLADHGRKIQTQALRRSPGVSAFLPHSDHSRSHAVLALSQQRRWHPHRLPAWSQGFSQSLAKAWGYRHAADPAPTMDRMDLQVTNDTVPNSLFQKSRQSVA